MNLLSELAGNIAYIEIKNYEDLSWDNLTAASDKTPSEPSGWDILTEAKEQLSGASASQNMRAMAGLESQGIKNGVIQVQYNPTSLKFSGSAKRDSDVTLVEAQKQKITTISAWGVLTMSVELVFCSTSDTDTSVSDQMTALLTMMQKSPTKEVTFSWADTVIEGKVTYFSGEYQMFYPSGLPQAGKISLKIEAESERKKIEKKIEKMVEEKPDKLAATDKT